MNLVETSLSPIALQKLLKRIEIELGRVFTEDKNGPRIIDLDILLYDSLVIETAELTIPEPGMETRHFQLQPIIDMDPFVVHGKLNSSVCMLSRELITIKGIVNDLVQVMPLSNSEENGSNPFVSVHSHQNNTLIMGMTDVFDESFNHVGKFDSFDEAVRHSMNLFKEGADIIGIFSQSKHACFNRFGPEEEAKILVPIIEGVINESKNYENKPIISVNTSDARVAQKVLDAGADIICNISDSDSGNGVFNVAAEYGCPLILTHTRDDSKAIPGIEEYDEKFKTDEISQLTRMNDIILSIRYDLSKKVKEALSNGVPRFNIILDPGIEFKKSFEQGFEILKRLRELTNEQLYSMSGVSCLLQDLDGKLSNSYNKKNKNIIASSQFHEQLFASLIGFPVIVGSSRYEYTMETKKEKFCADNIIESIVAVTSAIQGNATIVRVHDVEPTLNTVRLFDKIYRN
ncbi:Folate synthesis bifunctional protein, mitochondrial [Smittium culicis]|uniref:2-amino-4-hydroxy-6-hydroxymethyldihydropteridine diphosphokinase n=1 Tax=Smittium culicis TaxID=133412 RepID=A0A1R1Y8E3_9FUNG|nr:Folate synthesis bifunctional protein, mitochondrial [Smittium culicis]